MHMLIAIWYSYIIIIIIIIIIITTIPLLLLLIIILVWFMLDLINPKCRGGSSLTSFLSVPLQGFYEKVGCQLGLALGSPYGRIILGFLKVITATSTSGIESLDFLVTW